MKKEIVATLFTLAVSAFAPLTARAEKPQPKSKTAAVLLGLSPIPGAGLLYAGEPLQAAENLALTAGSVLSIYLGAVGIYTENGSEAKYPALGGILFVAGIAGIIGAMVWDTAGGYDAVKDHNEKISKKTSFLHSLQPTFAVTQNGFSGGAQINF